MTPRTITVEPWSDGSRGQLMLVGAILMALVVISTVVLLNGVQLSENTGSEDTLRATDQTQETTEALQTNVRTVFRHFDDNGGPYISTTDVNDFREDVVLFNQTYTNLTTFHTSSFVNVDIDSADSFTGMALRSDGGAFESASGGATWTVASDAPEMPYLSMNVTDQSANSGTDFVVRFQNSNDSTEYTELRFTEDEVRLDGSDVGSSVSLCSADTDGHWTHLRIVDGGARLETEGSLECDAFSVEFDHNVDVLIQQGSEATGSFLLTVGDGATITPGNYGPAGSGTPYTVGQTGPPVLINPALDIDYNSPDITYETSVWVMGRNIDK